MSESAGGFGKRNYRLDQLKNTLTETSESDMIGFELAATNQSGRFAL